MPKFAYLIGHKMYNGGFQLIAAIDHLKLKDSVLMETFYIIT